METEALAALATALSGVILEFVRRWAKASNEAKLAIAATMKAVSDGQRADNARAVEAVIEQARSGAQLMAELVALRLALNAAVDAREHDDSVLIAELKELQARVEALAVMLLAYDEFKRSTVYRPRKG